MDWTFEKEVRYQVSNYSHWSHEYWAYRNSARDESYQRAIDTYNSNKSWNAFEFGFFHRPLPSWILPTWAVAVSEKEKMRLTYLTRFIRDGSEEKALMNICRARKPSPFNYHTRPDFGSDYHAIERTWMTEIKFVYRLELLYRFIDQTPREKILMLLDNGDARRKKDDFPSL